MRNGIRYQGKITEQIMLRDHLRKRSYVFRMRIYYNNTYYLSPRYCRKQRPDSVLLNNHCVVYDYKGKKYAGDFSVREYNQQGNVWFDKDEIYIENISKVENADFVHNRLLKRNPMKDKLLFIPFVITYANGEEELVIIDVAIYSSKEVIMYPICEEEIKKYFAEKYLKYEKTQKDRLENDLKIKVDEVLQKHYGKRIRVIKVRIGYI